MATVSETRKVQDFTEIALQGYGNLILEQNVEGPESLTIEADEAMLPRLSSRVSRGRLVLGFDMPWYEWLTFWFTWIGLPNRAIRYRLSVNKLEELSLSGSGSVICEKLQADRCRLKLSGSGKVRFPNLTGQYVITNISGSGNVEVGGNIQRHEIHISGSGGVNASGLETRNTIVRISGSGSVTAAVSETLDIRISGSGSVRYTGQPKISQSITGSGRVREMAAQETPV